MAPACRRTRRILRGRLLAWMMIGGALCATTAAHTESPGSTDISRRVVTNSGQLILTRRGPDGAPIVTVDGRQASLSGLPAEAGPIDRRLDSRSGKPIPGAHIVRFSGKPVSQSGALGGLQRSVAKTGVKSQHDQFRIDLADIRTRAGGPGVSPVQAGAIQFQREYFNVLNAVAVSLDDREAAAVAGLPYVAQVHPDIVVEATLDQSVPLIHADDVQTSLSANGAGVKVAVIDTGIDYNHPDLGAGFGGGFKVAAGYDFANNDADPMDDNNHGTHVAGIVAANGAVIGVAPGATLYAYKVLGANGSGSSSNVIAGIERAIDPDQNPLTDDAVDIINLSLSALSTPDDPMSLALDAAVSAGVVGVCAAANNAGYETIGSPGCARKALTVGSVGQSSGGPDPFWHVASVFSSRGPALVTSEIKPEVSAPGYDINSTIAGGGYSSFQGTSMAAPHVAGTAALLLQLHPAWTPAMIEAALVGTAVPAAQDVMTQGAGRVDAYAAATAEILITSATVELGFDNLDLDDWITTTPVLVTNVNAGSVTYNLGVDESHLPVGVSTSIAPSVTLNAGESTTVDFVVSVDNTVVPGLTAPPYVYYGFIEAESGGKLVRAPFAFNKEQPDGLEPNNSPAQASLITVTSQRTLIEPLGRTRIDPDEPAGDPDEDWYRFTASAGQVFFAYADSQRLRSLATTSLELFSAGEALLKSGLVVESDPRIVFYTMPYTGTYYLKVAGTNGRPGRYRLFVNFLPPEVKFFWIAETPTGGNAVTDVSFSDNGEYFYASQYYNYLQLFETAGDGIPVYNLQEGFKDYYFLGMNASQDGSICVGSQNDYIQNKGVMDVFSTPSPTPIYREEYPIQTRSGAMVSDDGSRIVNGEEFGMIVQTPTGTVLRHYTNWDPSPSTKYLPYKLSTDGWLTIARPSDFRLYDLDAGNQRPASTISSGFPEMSGDGARLANSDSTAVVIYSWNGSSYQVDRVAPYLDWQQHNGPLWNFSMSRDGLSTFSAADETLPEDFNERIFNVIVDSQTGNLVSSYRTESEPVIPLQTRTMSSSFSEDGSILAFGSWGGDRRWPELVVMENGSPNPVFKLDLPGSIFDLDVHGKRIVVGIKGNHANTFDHSDDCGGAVLLIDLVTETPGPVSGLVASGDHHKIHLDWSNPIAGPGEFSAVRIQRSTSGYPPDYNDGQTIYDGSGESFTDSGLADGTAYYYTAFAHDGDWRFAPGVNASASTAAPSGVEKWSGYR